MRYLVCLLVAFLVLAPLAFGEVGNAEGSGAPSSGFPALPNPSSEGMMPFDLDLTAPEYTYSGWDYGSSGYEAYPGGSSGYGGHPLEFAEPAPYPGCPEEPGASPGCCGFWYTGMAASQSNTYYAQTWPHGLSTVASVRCGDWMPLGSRIGTPGTYWSFEWTLGDSYHGWTPDIKNFGYKNFGWYTSWFRSSTPGWHLLCYYCNDWSNYVYIYVKPYH